LPFGEITLNIRAITPFKGGSKTQNGRFPSKIALRLKKVCYKVSLCENCQRQSCGAFIGLTIRAKIIGEGRPLLPEILGQSDRDGAKSSIFDLFSFVAPQPCDLAIDTYLDDLERRNSPSFAFSHRIRLLCWAITS